MKQYSNDLRERVCRARDAGVPRAEIVRIFGISPSSVSRWHTMARTKGSVSPKSRSGRRAKIPPAQWDEMRAQVRAHPDSTLEWHCDEWESTHRVRVSTATMSRLMTKLDFTLKKSR